ncbi:carbohydrate ABC transporter permease [Phycicoccus endophyticus]|uniref:Carbohydrate ABC transporter permease n=1 Tax=Phycicoccus endophyticus TaxID=1690220 RepID=A0A7G9QYN6_9MICO|nr:carbohydrate ABC transporter permease [Phycicoccus endophyticus]NHI20504.1 carbohydrate ABC transporter permease [Phycicoccus endophyticus]QNN48461.1 carbohydrate ABC transporter permease [Phycicoccus endophyticus]GGL30213.1 ABC transporter permease [Phycicoccus endophyticus]
MTRRRYRPDASGRLHLVLVPLAALWLVPIVMTLGLSLLPRSNPKTTALGLLPESPSLSNYVEIWQGNPILGHLLNSVIISVPSIALTILFGSMSAFALARLRVPLKAVIFGALTLALILPMSSIIVSTFKILQSLGLYNNLLGLVLVYTALGLPFAVIIIRTAFLAIPNETYEAALIDGANRWTIYWKLYLPLARPALSVVVIWQLMMTWNDFLLPLVTLSDNALKPLTLVPLAYRGTFLSQPGALFAILVLISVPIVAVFLAVQRYLVNGLAGAVK